MEANTGENAGRVSAAAQAAETARGHGPNDCSPKESYESRNVVLGSCMQTSCREAAPGGDMESVGFDLSFCK